MAKQLSPERELCLLRELLLGCSLVGFNLGVDFGIELRRSDELESRFPRSMRVNLVSEWFVAPTAQWDAGRTRGIVPHGVEPDDPLRAAWLAYLRWNSGLVSDVWLNAGTLGIVFESGQTLEIAGSCDVDVSWEIRMNEELASPIPAWCVTCSFGVVYFAESVLNQGTGS